MKSQILFFVEFVASYDAVITFVEVKLLKANYHHEVVANPLDRRDIQRAQNRRNIVLVSMQLCTEDKLDSHLQK